MRRIVAIAVVAIAIAACSRDPAPVAQPPALTPEPEPAPVLADESTPTPDSTEPDPLDQAMSAAAGFPLALQSPLADGVRIDFEYGTLVDLSTDEPLPLREVMIEPIDMALPEATASLDRSLRSAGFELVESATRGEHLQRRFLREADGQALELALEASAYPDPESAAHPGGTGVIAMRVHPPRGQ